MYKQWFGGLRCWIILLNVCIFHEFIYFLLTFSLYIMITNQSSSFCSLIQIWVVFEFERIAFVIYSWLSLRYGNMHIMTSFLHNVYNVRRFSKLNILWEPVLPPNAGDAVTSYISKLRYKNVLSFDFAILIREFPIEFSSEFSIFVILLFKHLSDVLFYIV